MIKGRYNGGHPSRKSRSSSIINSCRHGKEPETQTDTSRRATEQKEAGEVHPWSLQTPALINLNQHGCPVIRWWFTFDVPGRLWLKLRLRLFHNRWMGAGVSIYFWLFSTCTVVLGNTDDRVCFQTHLFSCERAVSCPSVRHPCVATTTSCTPPSLE